MIKKIISNIISKRESYIILLTVFLWIIISTINSNFALPSYLLELIGFNSVYFICALGILPLMIKGHFDLSVGGMITAISFVLMVVMSAWSLPFIIILVIGTSLGIIIGSISGFLIGKFKVPSVIVTLAMMNINYGVFKYLNRIFNPRTHIIDSYQGMESWVENIMIVGMILLTYIVLHYLPVGRSIYAFGNSSKLAIKKKYSDFRTTVFVHGYSGFVAGIAAVIHVLTFKQASIDAYSGIEFELIIIVIIGGLHILGGYGTVLGTFAATLFVVILKSGLVFARIPVFWHDMIIGFMIIVIISYDMVKHRMNIQKLMGQGE